MQPVTHRRGRRRRGVPGKLVPRTPTTGDRFHYAVDFTIQLTSTNNAILKYNTRTMLSASVYAPIAAFYDNIHTLRFSVALRPVSTSSTSTGEMIVYLSPTPDQQTNIGYNKLADLPGATRLKLSSNGMVRKQWRPFETDQSQLNDDSDLCNLMLALTGRSDQNITIEIRFLIHILCSEPIANEFSRDQVAAKLRNSITFSKSSEKPDIIDTDCFEVLQ